MYLWPASWRQQGQDLLGQQPTPWLWDTEVVPGTPSIAMSSCQSCLSSAGKVWGPTSLAKPLRSTLDTGHARRQQLNCSLAWKRLQQVQARSHLGDRCMRPCRHWGLERERLTELTAVTDQQTELTLSLVSRCRRDFTFAENSNQSELSRCVECVLDWLG